ncbi:hypothetical protein [Chloroflexus aggregans]|uniref:Uncharacterized protein n=1 Tax=Chloroflexus aggregans (strain MD-66 / DSM 9485) TaxID=326427 RepID=B8G717_CHLAD|nr:hypothetical protein [Chloroflexus aggregans]ACL23974.1 conserved hypothetical protein [Chloroflexus aggregans DSM 9485]
MRTLLLMAIVALFLFTACGTATTSVPAQPTAPPNQPVPTQPPAATRDLAAPVPGVAEPTATQLPDNPAAQPVPAPTETAASLPPTVAPAATLVPTVMPIKESPMPIQPAPPFNAQPLQPPYSPTIEQQIAAAKQDLAQRLRIDAATIEVVSVEAVTWPDGSLGCPRPGMAYTQVLIDGLRILLRVGDQLYPYHSGNNQPPFLCESQMGSRAQP